MFSLLRVFHPYCVYLPEQFDWTAAICFQFSMTEARKNILAWEKRDAVQPPRLLKYRSSKVFILVTVCFAIFTVGSELNPLPNK